MSVQMSKKMLSLLMMAGVISLSACSGGDESAESKSAQTETSTVTNTMDVKQPEPAPAPKLPVAEKEPAPIEAPKAEPAPAPMAAVSGDKVYSTCAGCHGAQGEGGVGPKLAGQEVAAVVEKLQKYKAGEQMGPMTGMMAPMAAGLSDEEMQAVAEYVHSL